MALVTEEQKKLYRENRRRKYAEERETVLAAHKRWRDANKERTNLQRRLRRKNDTDWREKQNSRLRGRDQRHQQLKTHYGITKADYDAMLLAQGGVCAICERQSQKTLHVDHCHATGRVRGLLCCGCNVGRGCFKDDSGLFIKAVLYLEESDGPQYIF